MAVAILRIGGQTRYEPIDYAAREQQFVKHDGVEPAVERRFDRTGISPQLYGIAGLGLDGLIGMRDVRRNEAGDTPSILPRRCRSVVQRVEPEIVANLLRPHTVLPIDEPETGVRILRIRPRRPQQFQPLVLHQPAYPRDRLVAETISRQHYRRYRQKNQRQQCHTRYFQNLFHTPVIYIPPALPLLPPETSSLASSTFLLVDFTYSPCLPKR